MPSAIVSSATTPSATVSSAAMPSVVASCATASSAMKFVTTPTAMTRATVPSPMKFVTTPSALTRATAPSAVELVTMPPAMTPSAVSHSTGLSGTVPSAPVSSAGSSAVAVTVQTASSPSAGSNGPAHLHPASMGLMSLLVRPSCPNITIVPGRFPAAMCGGQMLPLASSSDAARTALLSLVQQLNQRPSATLQSTMMPASGDAPPGSDLVIDIDEKPVCQGVVKHEDKAVESSIVRTFAADGSGSVVSTSTVSCPLPLVDIDSLETDQQQTCTHSNGTSSPDRSSSRANVDETAQGDRKSPSMLELMLKNSDGDEERPSVTKRESDLSSVETQTLASDVEKPTVSVSATTSDGCLNRDSRAKNSDQKREPSRCRKLSSRERAASRLLQGLSRLCEPPNGAAVRMHLKKPRHSATLPEVAAPLSDSEFDGADGTEDASAQERCNSRLGGVATASEVPGKAGELPFWVVTPTSTVCVGSEVCPVPAESVRQAGNRGGSGSASLAGVSFGPSVLNRVFSFLPVAALCRVATVCWGWNLLSKHPNLWGQVDLRGVNVTDWDTCTLVLQQRQTHTLVVKGSSSSHLVPWVKRLDWVQSLSLYGGSLADLATLVKLFPQMTSLNAVQLTRPQQCRGDDARRESVLLGELQALVGMPRLRSLRLSSMGGLLLCPWAVPKEAEEQRFLALRTLSMTTLRCSSLEAFVSLKCLPHLEDLELGDCASWTNQSYLELGQLPKLKCLSLIRGQDQPCFRYVLLKLVHLEVLRLKRWTFRGNIGQLLAQLPRLRQLLLWPQARDLATNNVHALRSCLGLPTLQRLSWVIDCGGSVSCSLASGLEIPVASGRLCDCKASQLLSSQADNPCGCRLLEESLEGEEGTSMRWLTAGQLSGILARSLGAGTAVCVSLRVGF
uniref:F-box domain-containing protein n=1 Tax=Ixodes scapularis TaxID=6945 RepID=A0A4D5S4J7_IXOSC